MFRHTASVVVGLTITLRVHRIQMPTHWYVYTSYNITSIAVPILSSYFQEICKIGKYYANYCDCNRKQNTTPFCLSPEVAVCAMKSRSRTNNSVFTYGPYSSFPYSICCQCGRFALQMAIAFVTIGNEILKIMFKRTRSLSNISV